MPYHSLETFASLSEPIKRYSKGQCIGRGASKVVYKGFDEVEGIEVAWNEVACSDWVLGSAKERQHVMGEIQMLRQLKHRNVMRLFDWWYDRQGQVLVFITELLTDGSLRRFIRRKHAAGITLSALKRYAWQVLQGLVYLHGHYPPIIHRDLKCDNIFVNGAAGELKIGDLGFATLLKGMSAPLSVIGTPEFMAPELYDERYDEKVDIYSYGMCLLEMATQEYPYAECTNPAQIFRKVTNGVPPAGLQKVSSPELKEFILLTIQPDPSRRPEARQLLVHPFFEDVRQQIRSKGCLRMPPAAANAAAAAAVALAAAGMPPGEALVLDAAVVMGAGAAAGCLPATHIPQSMPTGLERLAKEEAAAEAAADAAPAGHQAHEQHNALTWGPTHSSSMAAAAAVMAAMAAAAGQQQQQHQPLQPLPSSGGYSACSSVLSTPMHSVEVSGSSTASISSWNSREQQQQHLHGGGKSGGGGGRRGSFDGGRRGSLDGRVSTDDLSEEDVLFDAADTQAAAANGDDADDAAGGGRKGRHRPKHQQHQQQHQQQQQEQPGVGAGVECSECDEGGSSDDDGQDEVYLSPIHEGEEEGEEEGVDCECRRIDQEQLSFNVGFFNAKGMKKRVGFQFNALEDTPESIGLEMVEQLALNAHQVRVIADKIRGALEVLGINSRAADMDGTPPPGDGPALMGRQEEPVIGQTAAFAIVATAAATAAIEEAAGPGPDAAAMNGMNGMNGSGSMAIPSPFTHGAAAAAGADGEAAGVAGSGGGEGGGSIPSCHGGSSVGGGGGAAAGSGPCSRTSSLGVSHSPGLPLPPSGGYSIHGSSGGQFVGGSSPSSLGLLGSSVAGSGGSGVDVGPGGMRMCPQQLVRQLSMLGRGTATALLANLQEDLLQQSYASPEAAACIGLEASDNGSGSKAAAAAGQQEPQQHEALADAVKAAPGGDRAA